MSWGSGCCSLYNLIILVVFGGLICVVWNINCVLCPISQGVYFFQSGGAKDDVLIPTIDDVEQNSVDDPFNLDKHGSDELDDTCLVVRAIHILGMDWFREAVTQELMSLDKSQIEAID